jgi:hypothetical protein
MNQLSFFTPIYFTERTVSNRFFESIENLFSFGSRRVVIFNDGTLLFEEIEKKEESSLLSKITQIFFKILVAPPVLIIKGVHRVFRKMKDVKEMGHVKERCPNYINILREIPKNDKKDAIETLNRLFGGSILPGSQFKTSISLILERNENRARILKLIGEISLFNSEKEKEFIEFFAELNKEELNSIDTLKKKYPKIFRSDPRVLFLLGSMNETKRQALHEEALFLGASVLKKIGNDDESYAIYLKIKELKVRKRETILFLLDKPELISFYQKITQKALLDIAEKGSIDEAYSIFETAEKLLGKDTGITDELVRKLHRFPGEKRGEIKSLFENKSSLFEQDFPFILGMSTDKIVLFEENAKDFKGELRSTLAQELKYIPKDKWVYFIEKAKGLNNHRLIKMYRLWFEICGFKEEFFNKIEVSRFIRDPIYIPLFFFVKGERRESLFEKLFKDQNQEAEHINGQIFSEIDSDLEEFQKEFHLLLKSKVNDSQEIRMFKEFNERYYNKWPRNIINGALGVEIGVNEILGGNHLGALFGLPEDPYAYLDKLYKKYREDDFYYPPLNAPFVDTIEGERLAFDLNTIRAQEKQKICGADLPKGVTWEAFEKVVPKDNKEHFSRLKTYLDVVYHEGAEVPESHYCLLWTLEMILKEKNEATQKEELNRFGNSLPNACSTGYDMNFTQYYRRILPQEKRFGKISTKSQGKIFDMAKDLLDIGFEKGMESLAKNDCVHGQEVHELTYIKSRISYQLGLPFYPEYDPYFYSCVSGNKNLETLPLLQKVLSQYSPLKYIDDLHLKLNEIKESFRDPNFYNQFIGEMEQQLGTFDMYDVFELEEDMTRIKSVKRKGAVMIAKAVSLLKTV